MKRPHTTIVDSAQTVAFLWISMPSEVAHNFISISSLLSLVHERYSGTWVQKKKKDDDLSETLCI